MMTVPSIHGWNKHAKLYVPALSCPVSSVHDCPGASVWLTTPSLIGSISVLKPSWKGTSELYVEKVWNMCPSFDTVTWVPLGTLSVRGKKPHPALPAKNWDVSPWWWSMFTLALALPPVAIRRTACIHGWISQKYV